MGQLAEEIARVALLLGLASTVACDSSRPGPPASLAAAGGGTGGQLPTQNPLPLGEATPSSLRPTPAPPVSLSGESVALSATLPGSPRVYARALQAWIHEGPSPDSKRLGYLRLGSSSPTGTSPAGTAGCPGGWYTVEPRGYVCQGTTATLDGNDPAVAATQEYPPDPTRKLPYIYGTVRRPGPIFQRLPGTEELLRAEPDLLDRMQQWLNAGGEIGAGYAQHVWLSGPGDPPDPRMAWEERRTEALPPFLADGKTVPAPAGRLRDAGLIAGTMKPRAGYSFLATYLWQGRRYGLTTDLLLMPTDRLRPIQGSTHHGVEIGPGKDIDFPFALVRRENAKYWLYQSSPRRLVEAGSAPYFTAVKLSGKQQFFERRLYYETSAGKWLSDQDASRIEPAKRMPKWGSFGEKWLDVNLTQQRVVLYEGTKPVYATLISSGEAGLEDAEHTTATKRGIFRIHTKHLSATMASSEVGEEFELRDVPYVQYFDREGYALHGAYWHDRFGTPKSHGCLNLSPEDARRIFYWTVPEVPLGWHGALLPLEGTVIFIHP